MSDFDLEKIFQSNEVMDMQTLIRLSGGRSRRSLFRDLAILRYISSYSHAGKFYTIPSIPSFDLNGLWYYGNVCFSKYGTLKATVRIIITESLEGFTHKELRSLLHVPVQNALNDLIRTKSIDRIKLESLFLYVSANGEASVKQLAQRREQTSIRSLNANTVIEILLELLYSDDWRPINIAECLRIKNIIVSEIEVKNVFLKYNIKKKTFT
ncbi:MAG: hypothetical protein H8D23_29950 [Candidatus Brocadiales bacterium]|nr:hypothetical protein [Candidatus Brocadiales bacterium]